MKLNDSRKIACLALAIAGLLSIFAMWHHPEIHAHDLQSQIIEMNQKASASRIVHGGLIGLVMLYCFGFMQFVQIRNQQHSLNNFPLLCFILGSIVMIGAGLIDGFIYPTIASSYVGVGDTELSVFKGVQRLSWHTNQALANTGTIAWLVAIILWSASLLREMLIVKLTAAIFVITAITTLVLFVFGFFYLNVPGMTFIVFLLAAFSLFLAYIVGTQKI